MNLDDQALSPSIEGSRNRLEFWSSFLTGVSAQTVAEVGVFRGEFAAALLRQCPAISRYYLLDPWRHLEQWNKPANQDDPTFQRFYEQTLERTGFAAERRVILRGTTQEMSGNIADQSLDFAYIDGDHTLRGITIDLLLMYPKLRPGGWLGGDDCCRSIWQHGPEYEPSLVFPFVVHFAEAMGARLHLLPGNQFLIEKPGTEESSGNPPWVMDHTGRYPPTDLRRQWPPPTP